MTPQRIQLSRAKGWRMPPNTVKVDRSTKWGNPFVVGQDGTAAYCVKLYKRMLGGWLCASMGPELDEQQAARTVVATQLGELRGKNLACWCQAGKPCHADVLLTLANAEAGGGSKSASTRQLISRPKKRAA